MDKTKAATKSDGFVVSYGSDAKHIAHDTPRHIQHDERGYGALRSQRPTQPATLRTDEQRRKIKEAERKEVIALQRIDKPQIRQVVELALKAAARTTEAGQ